MNKKNFKTILIICVFTLISCSKEDNNESDPINKNHITFNKDYSADIKYAEFQHDDVDINDTGIILSTDKNSTKDNFSGTVSDISIWFEDMYALTSGTYSYKDSDDNDFDPSTNFGHVISGKKIIHTNGNDDDNPDENWYQTIESGIAIITKSESIYTIELNIQFEEGTVTAFYKGSLKEVFFD